MITYMITAKIQISNLLLTFDWSNRIMEGPTIFIAIITVAVIFIHE